MFSRYFKIAAVFSFITFGAYYTFNTASVSSITSAFQLKALQPTTLNCTSPPRDNCSFYSTCLESRYHCGPAGYPIGYGQKFCQRFSEQRNTLSEQGQDWMVDTMHCLQQALVSDATTTNTESCSQLEDKAFASHAPCYLKNGLCRLSLLDWLAILRIVKFKTLVQSWDAVRATIDAGKGCL